MNIKHYKELDKLDREQDTLLALAVYDWYFFNDARVGHLKHDYSITSKNSEIFKYYHTDKPYLFELNHNLHVNHYKTMLQAMLYT